MESQVNIDAERIYNLMKGFRVKNSHRKKCALVCVDEILGVLDKSGVKGEVKDVEHWQAVKTIIQDL